MDSQYEDSFTQIHYHEQTGGKTTNWIATSSLICGILGFLTCGVLGFFGIILGFVGKTKAKQLGGIGSRRAVAGIVLGILSISISVLVGIYSVYMAVDDKSESGRDGNIVTKNRVEIENIGEHVEKGKERDAGDYTISGEKVFVGKDQIDQALGFGWSENANVIYSLDIKNTSGSEGDYSMIMNCTGNTGDSKDYYYVIPDLADNESRNVLSEFNLNTETISATCSVSRVTN